MTKDVKQIITEWLQTNSYDGLCTDNCGCRVEDLMPCDSPQDRCVPGYLRRCEDGDGPFGHGWEIRGEKRDTR